LQQLVLNLMVNTLDALEPLCAHECSNGSNDVTRAVVAVDALGQSALEAQALECGDHILSRQSTADRDRQAFTRVQIQHRFGVPM
jgi:hypothetical protein